MIEFILRIVNRKNNFIFISEQQSKFLEEEFNIFIRKSGRISISGLTEQNVSHVASAIHMAVTTVKN